MDMQARRELLLRALPLACWARMPRLPHAAGAVGAASTAQATIVPSGTERAALVIGNQRYKQNPLRSAVNDARTMAEILTRAGFAVDLRLDASRQQMAEAIDSFGRSLAGRNRGTSVFYYAGHAVQMEWRNYLLPVDAVIEAPGHIPERCVDLGRLLDHLSRGGGSRDKQSLIILDACRDNPFGKQVRLPQKGMSPYDAPAGTLLAYATAPGQVAYEPPGSAHGLYTEHLVRELAAPGVSVDDALKRVRLNVRLASQGRQIPWESSSLETDLLLFPSPTRTAAEVERQLRDELETWDKIKDSRQMTDWAAYLRRFPSGRFAETAQARLRSLLTSVESRTQPRTPATAGPLHLGKGLALPARLKAPANPHSAGTYPFRPVWTVGDQVVYQELDLFSQVVKRTQQLSIKRVNASDDRVETHAGSLMTLMGSTLRDGSGHVYAVPLEINPTDLQLGRKWTSRFEQSGVTSGAGEYEFRITAREKVVVPAGEFSAFRIEATGWFNGSSGKRALQMTRWVVPGINWAVRQEMRHSGTLRVMVSARQAVSV